MFTPPRHTQLTRLWMKFSLYSWRSFCLSFYFLQFFRVFCSWRMMNAFLMKLLQKQFCIANILIIILSWHHIRKLYLTLNLLIHQFFKVVPFHWNISNEKLESETRMSSIILDWIDGHSIVMRMYWAAVMRQMNNDVMRVNWRNKFSKTSSFHTQQIEMSVLIQFLFVDETN